MSERIMRVLVVDDEDTIRKLLTTRFEREGWTVTTANNGAEALKQIQSLQPDVVVTDIKMPEMDGFELIEKAKATGFSAPFVMITGHGDKECAIESMRKGAFDYLEKPFNMDEIAFVIKRAIDREGLRRANLRLIDELKLANTKLEDKLEVTNNLLEHSPTPPSKVEFVGKSESIYNLKSSIKTIAGAFGSGHDPVVLIQGESGVGKEVVARYFHEMAFNLKNPGGKNTAPFVAVNCAAFPENLLESELFGYEKGAFTGANSRKLGIFELANGGTVFLDEIGEIDSRTQVKLLRVLQERIVRRLGGTQDIPFTTCIVAATNKDLAAAVSQKTFREDLYYRLNTLPLVVPPLRSRMEDVPELAEHFLRTIPAGKKFKAFSPMAQRAIQSYKWPGNVRELRSVIERAVILESGPTLELSQLRQENMKLAIVPQGEDSTDDKLATVHKLKSGNNPNSKVTMKEGQTFADIRKEADEHFVKEILIQYLNQHQGNVSAVARDLKMDRANLLRMFRRFQLDAEAFRRKMAA